MVLYSVKCVICELLLAWKWFFERGGKVAEFIWDGQFYLARNEVTYLFLYRKMVRMFVLDVGRGADVMDRR